MSFDNININEKQPIKKKKGIAKYFVIIFIPIFIFLFFSGTYTVRKNEAAYVTRFSKMVNIEKDAGLHFKIPFIDSVRLIPMYQMLYDIPPSDVITADKQTLVVDNITIWRIDDPEIFMKTIASIPEMENRINAAVYSTIKNMFGELTREEIINNNISSVDEISDKVTKDVNEALKNYGVYITSVEIKKVDLPDSNASAVYERMISERTQIAEGYIAEGQLEAQKIRNDTDKQAAIIIAEAESEAAKIEGEAESEYMKILENAYSSNDKANFYKFVKGLETLKETMSGDDRTLILDEDSYIVKLLIGSDL